MKKLVVLIATALFSFGCATWADEWPSAEARDSFQRNMDRGVEYLAPRPPPQKNTELGGFWTGRMSYRQVGGKLMTICTYNVGGTLVDAIVDGPCPSRI